MNAGSDVSPPWCGTRSTSMSGTSPASSMTCCASRSAHPVISRVVPAASSSSTTESLFGSECEPCQHRSGPRTWNARSPTVMVSPRRADRTGTPATASACSSGNITSVWWWQAGS